MCTVWQLSCPEVICPQFNLEYKRKKSSWIKLRVHQKILARSVRRSARILTIRSIIVRGISQFFQPSFGIVLRIWPRLLPSISFPILLFTYPRVAHFFHKPRSHLKRPSARRVTSSQSCTQDPQKLGVTMQNLVARTTWRSGFVHPWLTASLHAV
jgi:hypothetical protein